MAALAVLGTVIWSGAAGAIIGVVGAMLIGAWILMTDDDQKAAANGQALGGAFGTSSAGAGRVDRKARVSGPPNTG